MACEAAADDLDALDCHVPPPPPESLKVFD